VGDVEHAGWAAGKPRRSPLRAALAVVLIGGGIAAAALGIVRLATEAGPSSDRIVAEGTVAALDGPAATPATFTAGGGEQFTVWLRAGGASNVRETVVAGTACDLARPDGTGAHIRGSRQGTSVATDHHETIGALRAAAGANTVSCRHVPFGPGGRRGALRDEHAFVVERGTPGDGLRGLWPMFGGILAIVAGVVAFTTSRRPASPLPG
jgi:hypothetical protein